jgi:hypothetical protein
MVTTSIASPQQASSASWKDNSLVVAIGTAVATSTFFMAVILPINTALLNNQLADLRNIKLQKAESDKKISSLEKKLTESDRKLQIAQHANLFPLGSPYPVGLSTIRVRDPITFVSKEFLDSVIDRKNEYCLESEGCMSVKANHGVIHRITYYFDEKSKDKPITHIVYSLGYPTKFGDSFLQEKLIEALGKPTSKPRKFFYSWKTSSNVTVYKSDFDRIMVMSNDWTPGSWPQE